MGGDPATMEMVSILASSILGGVTAPQGQKLRSFAGSGDTDPQTMAHEAKGLIGDFLGATMDRAAQPVTMNTTVNPLPNFVGGGLPMAIAAPGQDANRLNPALRTTPGITIPRRTLSDVSTPTGGGGIPVGSNPNAPPSRGNPPATGTNPRPPASASIRNPNSVGPVIDENGGVVRPGTKQPVSPGGDPDQAMAAFELLKKAGLQF